MESSEAGPSTSVTNSAAGIVAPGGNVTARDVIVNNYNSALQVDEFPLPRLIDTFYGREDEMRELDEAFFSQQKNKVVICGLGGLGKSELSKQFAHKCQVNGKVQIILWIESEDSKKLKKAFKKLKPIYEQCTDKQLLVIFDNCVNQQSITNYEPNGNQNHRVLITSQYKQWSSDVKTIELESLSSGPAMDVFRSVLSTNYRVEDEHSYTSLAHLVGYIPLGLQVVASYIKQGDDDFKLTEYVNEIKKSEHHIINEPIPDCAANSYKKTNKKTMMITSIDKIKSKSDQKLQIRELAHDVLCFCAYLPSDRIWTEDLLFLTNRKNNKCNYNENNEFIIKELKSALKLLSNYLFLRQHGWMKDRFVQHRSTQAFVRYYISEYKLQQVYYKMCLDLHLKEGNFFTSTILSYADSNFEIVHDFYKNNYMHKNIGVFLQDLIRRECSKCIKTIFENLDEQTKNHINKYNILAECASTENVEILKVLLSHVDINLKNDNQDTTLHVLARKRYLKGIKFLVRHGADVNVPNAAGDPLLFTLIRGHDLINPHDWDEVFKTLLLKADFSLTDSNNQTLLHAAATGQQFEFIDLFIKNGLQINQTDKNGWTPLDSLYHQISKLFDFYYNIDYYVPILEKLLILGATSNIKHTNARGDSCGYLLLKCALDRNNLELFELLLNSGADINSRSCDQQTILHTCAIRNNLKATQILIKHKADCYVRDRDGDTPLFYFVQYKFFYCAYDMDLLKNMLDLLQCHPGHVDAAGNTILHAAVEYFNVKLVKMLLTVYKFNVNIQNSNGDTPLHALISSITYFLSRYDMNKENIIQIIKMFKNARLDLENYIEKTPLDMLQRICIKKYYYIINDLSPYLTPAPASVNNKKRKLDS